MTTDPTQKTLTELEDEAMRVTLLRVISDPQAAAVDAGAYSALVHAASYRRRTLEAKPEQEPDPTPMY